MPRIQTSKRCQRCKRRKVKVNFRIELMALRCVFTPCFRAYAVCSGPPADVKFVHNGVHATTNGADSEVPSQSTSTKPQLLYGALLQAIVAIISRHVPGGASYSVLRLSQGSRPNLITVADRLAANLVRHLENGSDSEFLLALGHIKFVPARVGASPA